MASKFSNMAFYTTAKLLSSAGTGDTVTISNDIERDASVSLTDSAQVLYTSLDGTSIERMTCTATGGTFTIVERWLDQSASPSEVSALMKERKSGTLVKVVHAAADIVDVNGDNDFTGDNTFSGDCEFTKTLKEPIFADTTARDAVTSWDWDVCYVTADGKFYDKVSWSRVARESGGTFANASTTVAGKWEVNTTAESKAWTDTWTTGAKTWTLASDIAANEQSATFIYAEDGEASDTYVIALTPTLTALTTWQRIRFKATTVNTGACTINVDTLWAKSIKTTAGDDPSDGDISASEIVELVYDGTNFVLQKAPIAAEDRVWLAEMCTDAEVVTGTDEERYINSKQAKDNYQRLTSVFQWTRASAAAAWNITYAHGLGVIPKLADITSINNYNADWTHSMWFWDWTNNMCTFYRWASTYASNSSTKSIVSYAVSVAAKFEWYISAADATNITITWTKAWSPTWTLYFTIKCSN